MEMHSRDRKERLARRKVNGCTDFDPEEEYEDEVVRFRDLELGSITPVVSHEADSS